MREQAAKMRGRQGAWTVKKLGKETVNGYSCEHVLLTRAGDAKSEMEWWTSKDISGLNYESMRGLMRRGSQNDEGMMKALRDAGADGFVVKMVTREKGSPTPVATMELTKVEKKSLPASMFEIPAGYTKQEGMMGAAGVMASPEQPEQMRKAMENLTPEQRKQIEEMMKGGSRGSSPEGALLRFLDVRQDRAEAGGAVGRVKRELDHPARARGHDAHLGRREILPSAS